MGSLRMLAILYDLHPAAVRSGQEPSSAFGSWLAEPETPPDAVSVLGGAGAGIRWYSLGENIVGFVGGRPRGCYVVAREDEVPQSPVAPLDPPAEPVRSMTPVP